MSSIMTKRGNQDNIVTYEFVCDTAADLQKIEQKYITIGSIATVIAGETGFEVYMANSQKEWVNLGSVGESGNGNQQGGQQEQQAEQESTNPFIIRPSAISYNESTTSYQKNISISNFTITGKICKDEYNSGWLFLMIKPDNYILEDFDYGPLDNTQDSILITITNASNEIYIPYNSQLYFYSEGCIALQIVLGDAAINFSKFTPSEYQEWRDLFGKTEIKEYEINHIVESYDISQLEYIGEDWDQVGE